MALSYLSWIDLTYLFNFGPRNLNCVVDMVLILHGNSETEIGNKSKIWSV